MTLLKDLLMYKTCTYSGIPYGERFIIRCFIQGFHNNVDYRREMLDCGVLQFYELALNEVLVLVNDIKLNKTSHDTRIQDGATANAISG